MIQLSEHVKISQAITPTAGAAGTSAVNGAACDMGSGATPNYDGVLAIVPLGAIVSGGSGSVKAQQDNDSAFGAAADLDGSEVTFTDAGANTAIYVDIKSPTKRYVRVVVTRTAQNVTVGGATYLQYHGRRNPSTHGAGVSGIALLSPAEA
jgi:hypothetical protein